ncbi:MAG TPA: ABC transporter permease [bacterium]|nr:ABC transporter permease [bacterium]
MAATAVELLIESTNYARPRDRARELWAFREVILAFAERNVRVKYKQAVLGVLWAVLQPLIFLGVFMVVFGRMANISAGSTSYPAFALAALVPWFFVQTAVTFGAQALLMDSALLRKVYFPRETPVLGAVLSAGLDFAMGFALLMALEPVLGGHLSWNVLMVVPLWLTLAVLTTGVSLILGALNVYYRDFRFVLPVLLQLWMFASPVAYPLSAVRAQWRELYIVLNPAAGILEGFRRALAEGHLPDLGLLALSAGTSCLVAWIGYWFFKRMEPGLADVV